jgi:hypothetical protein
MRLALRFLFAYVLLRRLWSRAEIAVLRQRPLVWELLAAAGARQGAPLDGNEAVASVPMQVFFSGEPRATDVTLVPAVGV